MKLSNSDAQLFFDLMWGLQYFVNKKHKIIDNINSLNEYSNSSTEEKMEVRAALYSDIGIIDTYIQENPLNLTIELLDIISGWRLFVKGSFYIERYLKRCAIFINNDKVYGVLGLYQNFDELIHSSRLPIYVQTVLLPFKGKIIFDGLFQAHNIYFGSGIKRELKESYLAAKQNNRILESFDTVGNDNQKLKENSNQPLNNWSSEFIELANISKKLRGKASDPAIFSPAFSLVKASIEFAQIAVSDPNDQASLFKALNKVRRAYNKSNTALDRQE